MQWGPLGEKSAFVEVKFDEQERSRPKVPIGSVVGEQLLARFNFGDVAVNQMELWKPGHSRLNSRLLNRTISKLSLHDDGDA